MLKQPTPSGNSRYGAGVAPHVGSFASSWLCSATCSVSPGRTSINGEVRQPLYVRSSSWSVASSVGLLMLAATRSSGRSTYTSFVPDGIRSGPGWHADGAARRSPSVRGAARPVAKRGTAAKGGLAGLEAGWADADGIPTSFTIAPAAQNASAVASTTVRRTHAAVRIARRTPTSTPVGPAIQETASILARIAEPSSRRSVRSGQAAASERAKSGSCAKTSGETAFENR